MSCLVRLLSLSTLQFLYSAHYIEHDGLRWLVVDLRARREKTRVAEILRYGGQQ